MQLRKGAPVVCSDGAKVGILDCVITDPAADSGTHLVIASGLWHRRKKLIPACWLGDVLEDQVRMSVGSCLFEYLREFRPVRSPSCPAESRQAIHGPGLWAGANSLSG